MSEETIFTKLGSIKVSDFWRGLIVAILTTPLTIIYQSISAGGLVFDWKAIVTTGLAGGVAYILKNMSTGSGGQLLTNAEKNP